ncbi:Oidioi.mRNA.OKI2018_I69.chr2.g6617.t1.cds [Oikopleura dioica]|uniref:Oidioi.mRNA.OKI2018_I69.chr2.g6617.t1.cds n=1 Tax=Oikopleura dioica TaxID=34765 RepID=A0ABN7TAH9_OIKDI|nr:Oidioi.mRNA.OKI2018_I69.chr2.g6617.t1.cds [Oikopleura dioica]
MDENNMMQNFMAAMGVMSTMMSQYNPAQPTGSYPSSNTRQADPGPTPNLGPGYGYGAGAMAQHAPAPPPPPPEKEDIPLPPSYNYPRFLEPEMEKSRKIIEAESSGWSRKTDEDLQKEKELSEHQKSLIAAAEKAAKINKKLTGYEQKPIYDKSNVPDPARLAQDRPLTNLALTYIPTERDETTGITNVPFVAQKGPPWFKSLSIHLKKCPN